MKKTEWIPEARMVPGTVSRYAGGAFLTVEPMRDSTRWHWNLTVEGVGWDGGILDDKAQAVAAAERSAVRRAAKMLEDALGAELSGALMLILAKARGNGSALPSDLRQALTELDRVLEALA